MYQLRIQGIAEKGIALQGSAEKPLSWGFVTVSGDRFMYYLLLERCLGKSGNNVRVDEI